MELEDPVPPYTISVLQNRVVYFHCHFVAIYLLPDDASGDLGLLTPTFKVPHYQRDKITYVFHSGALTTSREPFFFHIHTRNSKTFRTYELPLGASAPIAHSSRTIRYASKGNRSSHDPWGLHPAPYTTIGNTYVVARTTVNASPGIVWIDMGDSHRTSGSLERGRSPVNIGFVELCLWEGLSDIGVQAMAFDPGTGRACATDSLGFLIVTDYVNQASVLQ